MSGGSYNYLCYKDAHEILSWEGESELKRMADRLSELGYADDAAQETYSLLLQIRQSRNYTSSVIDRMSDVWRAVEWNDSGDSNEDSIREALEKYRTQTDT